MNIYYELAVRSRARRRRATQLKRVAILTAANLYLIVMIMGERLIQ